MEFEQLLKDAINRDIIGLLAVSNLPVRAKKIWIALLEHMTAEEKGKLKAMLEEEVRYEVKAEGEAVDKFLSELNAKVNADASSEGH